MISTHGVLGFWGFGVSTRCYVKPFMSLLQALLFCDFLMV